MEEFQLWRSKENREVDYACARSKKTSNGDQLIYYNCNRSDSYGALFNVIIKWIVTVTMM